MLRGLRPFPIIHYRIPVSKRLISSMASAGIVLPNEEIEELWFGGLNLRAAHTPAMDAVKRWFFPDPNFDTSCK
jgi:hypothetical protein